MTTNKLIKLNSICDLVVRTIFLVNNKHPNWLKERFRNYVWHNYQFQHKFKDKLELKLKGLTNYNQLVNQLIELFHHIFYPGFFNSDYFKDFLDNLDKLKGVDFINYLSLSVLLLDTENIYIDINSEKILGRVCQYPIKLKFAFGNWRNLGKKDIEFYERGYELLHVPPGKNSADLKMISFGSSIWLNYPNAKEVLICSSDGDLNHLSTALQNHGIIVYKVSRRGNELVVINSQTTQIQIFYLTPKLNFPSFNNCLNELLTMIKNEQKQTKKNWIELTRLEQVFQEKFQIELKEILEYYYPNQTIDEIFSKSNCAIVTYTHPENSQLYLSLFNTEIEEKTKKQDSLTIDSPVNLEKALIHITEDLTQDSKQKYIAISYVASEFQKKYKVSITKAMQKLDLGKKFLKLIESYDSLEVKQENHVYYVALRNLKR